MALTGGWYHFATDTDGFVIPSLGIEEEETDQTKVSSPKVEIQEPPPKVAISNFQYKCQQKPPRRLPKDLADKSCKYPMKMKYRHRIL